VDRLRSPFSVVSSGFFVRHCRPHHKVARDMRDDRASLDAIESLRMEWLRGSLGRPKAVDPPDGRLQSHAFKDAKRMAKLNVFFGSHNAACGWLFACGWPASEKLGRGRNGSPSGTSGCRLLLRCDLFAIRHYLHAIEVAGADEASAVMAKMREIPVNDFYTKNGRVREDGRLLHDMYFVQVKTPAESKSACDHYKVFATIPGNEAFRPPNESGCPLIKQQ
jgi:hypothetical protein